MTILKPVSGSVKCGTLVFHLGDLVCSPIPVFQSADVPINWGSCTRRCRVGWDTGECFLFNNYAFILTCIRKIGNKDFKAIDSMHIIIIRIRLNQTVNKKWIGRNITQRIHQNRQT